MERSFSVFSRTAARFTLFTQRCRFGAFHMFYIEYSYLPPILYSIRLKSYFLKSLKSTLVLVIYSLFISLRVCRLICLNAEFSVISVSKELFVM